MSFKRKLLMVGDDRVGKTSLLLAFALGYAHNYFEYLPTVMDWTEIHLEVDGEPIALSIWDTHDTGGYGMRRLRPLMYPETNIFLLCCSVDAPDSFESAPTRWLPELTHFSPQTPILLIGCKKDLRTDEGHPNTSTRRFVSCEHGKQAAVTMGLSGYLECSAQTGEGIREVLLCASEIAYHRKVPRRTQQGRGCIVV